jgi:hypothetical protein
LATSSAGGIDQLFELRQRALHERFANTVRHIPKAALQDASHGFAQGDDFALCNALLSALLPTFFANGLASRPDCGLPGVVLG